MVKIDPSEITPEAVYLSRRQFITGMGALLAGSLVLAACGAGNLPAPGSSATPGATSIPTPTPSLGEAPGAIPTAAPSLTGFPPLAGSADELGAPLTPLDRVTTYNNFYEFSMDKTSVARLSESLVTSPWTVEVGGLVNKPRTFDLDDMLKFEQEERIYRLRCVETWSMVIPWIGFPLARLLKEVEPTSAAKFVRFQTLYDPKQMPGQESRFFQWPYAEGLRLDEAMHDLTLLATGLYGKQLLPQNGAPVRLVVPWKYGFKSIKSVVKIELVDEMPVSLWMAESPREYGFWANVNPDVPHPRWSQATELRIGESDRRDTLLFNGYTEEVAGLYQPPGLREWFY